MSFLPWVSPCGLLLCEAETVTRARLSPVGSQMAHYRHLQHVHPPLSLAGTSEEEAIVHVRRSGRA